MSTRSAEGVNAIEVSPPQLNLAAQAIEGADALLITAGAGMGVDSGLADFRGSEGFWRAYPAIAKLGLSVAEMANPAWFERSPSLAWAFYRHRLNRRTIPHDGGKPPAHSSASIHATTPCLRAKSVSP